MAAMRTLAGGEVAECTKLLAEAREQALGRMETEVARLGANVVVGLGFHISVGLGGAEQLAYDAAVVLAEEQVGRSGASWSARLVRWAHRLQQRDGALAEAGNQESVGGSFCDLGAYSRNSRRQGCAYAVADLVQHRSGSFFGCFLQ